MAVETFRIEHDLTGSGYTLAVQGGEHIAREVAGGNPYEWDLVRVMATFVRPGDVMLDIGAHVGNHSVYVGLAHPAVKIHAFEANPETFGVLRRNIEANGLDARVTCHQAAVGHTTGTVNLVALDGDDTGSTAVRMDEAGVVRVAPLSDLYDGPFCFVKIDVEGFELEVLNGMRGLLERERPVLAMELHQDARTRSETLRLLRSVGYRRLPVNMAYSPTFLFVGRRSHMVRLLTLPAMRRRMVVRAKRRVAALNPAHRG